MFQFMKRWFQPGQREERVHEQLDKLRDRLPVPVFWLFGKTQSGKSSVVKALTGADDAEIGQGFQPCTRFSRQYQFPTAEAPLMEFLDTRGLDEPGYDADEDLKEFDSKTHIVLVVVKALDHAQENVLHQLRKLRKARPNRPVVLVLTCLHEAYPQQQHPTPYPFGDEWEKEGLASKGQSNRDGPQEGLAPPLPPGLDTQWENLLRSMAELRRRFEGVVDRVVAVDLTPAEEGFNDPEYGLPRLREVLVDLLPATYRQTILSLEVAKKDLQDLYAGQALPHIVGYSSLAATAGAVPVPGVDLVMLSAIQTRMVYHLAKLYGQPMTSKRFGEIASTLGVGILVRQAGRSAIKLVPGIGTVVGAGIGAVLAGASTFALGKAFCYYYRAVHEGHVPQASDLRQYYREQLSLAERAWGSRAPEGPPAENKE